MTTKQRKKAADRKVKDLPAKKVSDRKGKEIKGGMPQGPPTREIPPGPPI
jgi:hypothetical protein